MNRQELMNYLKIEKKKELPDFLEEFRIVGLFLSEEVIETYKKKYEIKDQDNSIFLAMLYTTGYLSTRYPGLIYTRYLNPLILKIRNYFYLLLSSTILLLISLIYILATINYNSIKILLVLIIPALVGISLSVLRIIKMIYEIKKISLENKKLEKEQKLEKELYKY